MILRKIYLNVQLAVYTIRPHPSQLNTYFLNAHNIGTRISTQTSTSKNSTGNLRIYNKNSQWNTLNQ